MRAALCFIAAAAAAACAAAAGPTPPASCDGAPNDFPITSPTPKLVRSFGGGSRYSMAGTNISVLHLRGSAFEMGQQYGSLMREEIDQLWPEMLNVRRRSPASAVRRTSRPPRVIALAGLAWAESLFASDARGGRGGEC